jgi:hypothetical protein
MLPDAAPPVKPSGNRIHADPAHLQYLTAHPDHSSRRVKAFCNNALL